MKRFKPFCILILLATISFSFFTCSLRKNNSKVHKDITINEESNTNEDIILMPEVMPVFPGGETALMNYISSNIKYPQKAIDNGIQGRVLVSFVIEKDGSISNITILRGISTECDEEAVNLVKNMPKWEPGKDKGKSIRTKFTLPVRFGLQQ